MAPAVGSIVVAARQHRRPAGRVLGGAAVVTLGVVLIEGAGGTSLTGGCSPIEVLACELAFPLLPVPLLARPGPPANVGFRVPAGRAHSGGVQASSWITGVTLDIAGGKIMI